MPITGYKVSSIVAKVKVRMAGLISEHFATETVECYGRHLAHMCCLLSHTHHSAGFLHYIETLKLWSQFKNALLNASLIVMVLHINSEWKFSAFRFWQTLRFFNYVKFLFKCIRGFLQNIIVWHRHFSAAVNYEMNKCAFDSATGFQQQSSIFVSLPAPRKWNTLPVNIISKATIDQLRKL